MRYCHRCSAGTTSRNSDTCPRKSCTGVLKPEKKDLGPKIPRNRFGKVIPEKYRKKEK